MTRQAPRRIYRGIFQRKASVPGGLTAENAESAEAPASPCILVLGVGPTLECGSDAAAFQGWSKLQHSKEAVRAISHIQAGEEAFRCTHDSAAHD